MNRRILVIGIALACAAFAVAVLPVHADDCTIQTPAVTTPVATVPSASVVDANNDGRKDPYNPVDAIFAAARYLKAADGDKDIRKAIFAYNHATWYVDSVMLRAKLIGGLPAGLVGSLTGLTQGHFPVHARARYAPGGPGHRGPGRRRQADGQVAEAGQVPLRQPVRLRPPGRAPDRLSGPEAAGHGQEGQGRAGGQRAPRPDADRGGQLGQPAPAQAEADDQGRGGQEGRQAAGRDQEGGGPCVAADARTRRRRGARAAVGLAPEGAALRTPGAQGRDEGRRQGAASRPATCPGSPRSSPTSPRSSA